MTAPPERPRPGNPLDYGALLEVAIAEAHAGVAEGGLPFGAGLFDGNGELLGRAHNLRLQTGDPTAHAEVEAVRRSPQRADYRDAVLATTTTPCWMCSGLVRQFGIRTVVVGDSSSYAGDSLVWLEQLGVCVVELHSGACREMFETYVAVGGHVWAPPTL